MPNRVAVSTLNASTVDILNTIRQNASAEFQSQVPAITKASEIPLVGQAIMGYPALQNQFISALVNRIALVRIKSAAFNNPFEPLKKGYLEFGETVEEVFVNLTKAREFSVEKAAAREFKRTLPDVRGAFHAMNWRVQYPITIEDEELRTAFLSAEGIRDLIAKIVNAVYTAANYDEYLLFKYVLIKKVTAGEVYAVHFDNSKATNAAKAFRAKSNQLTMMHTEYNKEHVHTVTPREDQYIFMDADFNAEYDVDVLAAAFNMDKATFMGHLQLVDSFTTFDNERFSEIVANTDAIEVVTPTELTAMKNVKAVLVDKEWFQFYDNQMKMTESYVASGEYWNYFLNVWKTVSVSPFSNAIVFSTQATDTELPASVTITWTSKDVGATATTLTAVPKVTAAGLNPMNILFEQTGELTKAGIACHKYGAYLVPKDKSAVDFDVVAKIGDTTYKGAAKTNANAVVPGSTLVLNKQG